MYAQMARCENLDVTVLYCSDQGVKKRTDRQFRADVAWDIPVLEGYRSVFLKNFAPRPSVYGFWGLQNWGVVAYLLKAPQSVLVVNGWNYPVCLAAILAGRVFGHTVCLRGESPLTRELKKSKRSIRLRRFLLGNMLFRLVHYFLYIGSRNKGFYEFYGVPGPKLIFTPYSVDNERFIRLLPKDEAAKKALRRSLNLPESGLIVLYSGKYMPKKRPLDLLEAFARLDRPGCCLVMVGDGELRPQMEAFIESRRLAGVRLTGFVNQQDIPRYYAAADIFVMCSDADETWGLSVNEAMNLGLPVIVSDETGCAADLVRQGENGFVFPAGDVDALAACLGMLVRNDGLRASAGDASRRIIDEYSYQKIIDQLKTIPCPQ